MGTPNLDLTLAQDAVDLFATHGSIADAARAAGISKGTLSHRLEVGRRHKLMPGDSKIAVLQRHIKALSLELARSRDAVIDADAVRQQIIGLREAIAEPRFPTWTIEPRGKPSAPGVPTLFISDLHWGERVSPSQIMNKNEYNRAIAHARMKNLIESAIHLLRILSPTMDYPGIVVPLGGDMISGNIHDELSVTNELNSMPAVLDLYGVLIAAIKHLADTFGRVLLVCVTGNHGRDTTKIWHKDRHHTSFDWLLYNFLAKYFEGDKRVTFYIPDGPDAYYCVYSHRYVLTHGDQFRGGDGVIGALGPIIRGDQKKRARNAQIDMEYDTLLMGHWHQYIHLVRLIVNGSLKGYDEYAYSLNFPFEPPQQALWVTHPKYGITYRMPVYVDRYPRAPRTSWAAVAK